MQHAMMAMYFQDLAIPPLSVLQEMGDAGDGRGGGTRLCGNGTIAVALREEARHLESFAERLQLAERGHIAEEVCNVIFGTQAGKTGHQ